jgi:REP element-mobilizing transposase RayT
MEYRSKVPCNPVLFDLLKTEIYNISKKYDVAILSIKFDKNDFHMIFTPQPTLENFDKLL